MRTFGISGLVLAFFCLVPACSSPGPKISPALEAAAAGIEAEAIAEHMRYLASDELEGRGTGTGGYLLAADYVAARFEEIGLQPAGGDQGYFQEVPLQKADLIAEHTSLTLIRDGRRIELELDRDYVMDADHLRERAELTAPLTFVGFGVSAPEMGYDDYAGSDVREKIVVQFSGAPSSFPSDQRAYYSSTELKRRMAVEHGAVGIIVIMTPEERARDPWALTVRYSRLGSMRWMRKNGHPAETLPELFFTATLSDEGMKRLFQDSPTPLEQTFEAAREGLPQHFDLPLSAEARSATSHTTLTSPNVIGLLKGADEGDSTEYLILTAHLDHIGIGEPIDGDAIHNGAYDNASGIAILIEVARALAGMDEAPRRSVLFAALTGEEMGLLGSKYFVEHPTVPIERLIANINLDMVLMNEPLSDVVAFGAEHSSLDRPVERAAKAHDLSLGADPIPQEVIFIRSDQFPFVRRGIPAVFMVSWFDVDDPESLERFGNWMGEVYHTPRDDMQQPMDFEVGATFARVNLLTAHMVADDPERPAWNEGDFFGERFAAAPAPN